MSLFYVCFWKQVRWLKDSSEIRKGKKYEIIAKGRQHILIIHKSVFDDEAEYECDAKVSKSSGMLTVIGESGTLSLPQRVNPKWHPILYIVYYF
jgi:hypothetical protein